MPLAVSSAESKRLKKRTYFQTRALSGAWGPVQSFRRVWQDADGGLHFFNARGIECVYSRNYWRRA